MIYLYIFLSLIASAFFSGMEIAFLSSDKLRLELDRSRGGVSARILGLFYSRPDHFITTMLLGNNVALVIYGLLTAVLMEPWLKSLLGENDGLILLAQSVLSTLLILFVGEFLPKVTFRANPNRTMRFFAGILFLVYVLLYPFVYVIGWITRLVLFLAGQRSTSVAIRPALSSLDLEYYLTHSSDDGQASGIETEVKIIQNAIGFAELQVRDCLLPRNEIVGAELNTTREHLERLFISTGLSKLIIYRDNIDDVVGYIHSSEMFRPGPWQERIVPAVFVPESMQTSTLMGVARRAGLYVGNPTPDQDRRLRRALMADSTAIVAGSVLGTSSATAYVESAAGVQAGGRTGLTALTVAALFLLALFFSPLAAVVPPYATAPALMFVACLMVRDLADLDWRDSTETVPAVITTLAMPFTYSVANGLAFGFISYVALKTLTGRWRDVHPLTWIIALLFLVRFAWLTGH